MKSYKNVMIEILELKEDVICTSGDPASKAEQYNGNDDTINAFGL